MKPLRPGAPEATTVLATPRGSARAWRRTDATALLSSLPEAGCRMLAARLIRLVETHAEELVQVVLRDLRTNPRTASFTRVPEPDLRHRLRDLYTHLGDWIGDKTETRVERQYMELGRRRYHEGVPLAELIYAMVLFKDHLRQFIRSHGLVESVVELYSEEQLYQLTWSFFDRAVYFTVKGYEDERRQMAELAAVRQSLEAATG